jgi:hypothetical protein
LAAQINVATHQLLSCVRSFDEAGGWHEQGAQSCAHWLAWRVGLNPGAAREKVRVARALGGLPKIDAALAAGRLSYSQVRAVTRIATADNEERVLAVALAATGAQLERICRGFRKATGSEMAAASDRRVQARVLGDGLVRLELVVSADEADLVMKAIEVARQRLSPPTAQTPEATGEGTAARAPRATAVDAVVRVVEAYLADSETEGDAGKLGPGRAEVIIHVDRELMSPDHLLTATLEDGTHVSAETLRRVACDGGLIAAALDEGGGVLDIGRRTRAIPGAIRRALWIRDQGCRFPGCANSRFLQGHHVRHWLHGGRTALDNLVLLCSFHHRQVHEGGFGIGLCEEGEVRVSTPDGRRLPDTPVLSPDVGAVEWGDYEWTGDPSPRDADIDEWTTAPSWDGSPVDYDAAVGAIVAG